jgi:phage regulator Rha-like protein
MTVSNRIENLKPYIKSWEEMRDNAAERRNRALSLKNIGIAARDQTEVDVLQKQADDADNEARVCHENVVRMQSLLGRAQAGEEV